LSRDDFEERNGCECLFQIDVHESLIEGVVKFG